MTLPTGQPLKYKFYLLTASGPNIIVDDIK